MRAFTAGIAAALLALGAPLAFSNSALAQIGGDSFQFIKAVKDRDVLKAREIIDHPGSTIVNAKDGETGATGLHLVTHDRDIGWMQFLLQEGADVNARDRDGATALIVATDQHFVDGAKLLLQVGADPNATNKGGETALIKAVQGHDTALTRLLVENGANPDKTDNVAGQSARDYAKQDRRSSMIARILDEATPKATTAATFSLAPKPPAKPASSPPQP